MKMGSLIDFFLTGIIFLFAIVSKNIVAYPTENLSNVTLRIVHGTVAKYSEFSYVAGIDIFFQNRQKLTCAGSLISSTSILTAAHCLRKGKQAKIVLGTTNINEHSTDKIKQTFFSSNFIMHSKYDKSKKLNDIGIIKLPHPATFNNVKLIPIPKNDRETYVGKLAIVMGWGRTSDTLDIPIQKDLEALRFIINPIISNENCTENHPDLKPFVRDTNICQSGEGGKSTCEGDSGAPLVVDGVQIGIMSFGYRLCEGKNPAVFTRLSKYIQWIKDNA